MAVAGETWRDTEPVGGLKPVQTLEGESHVTEAHPESKSVSCGSLLAGPPGRWPGNPACPSLWGACSPVDCGVSVASISTTYHAHGPPPAPRQGQPRLTSASCTAEAGSDGPLLGSLLFGYHHPKLKFYCLWTYIL